MIKSALVCLATGSEEIEAVTTIDLLVRAGIHVTTASVTEDNNLTITCSRGVKLITDTKLITISDEYFDAIVLPGGAKGAEFFRDTPLLIEKIRQTHLDGGIIAAICAAPALVLQSHRLFPFSNMTCYPALKDLIPKNQWVDKRVCYDQQANLLTSQGPATAIDFALKLIALLIDQEKAAYVAQQLILPPGIYDYQINDDRL